MPPLSPRLKAKRSKRTAESDLHNIDEMTPRERLLWWIKERTYIHLRRRAGRPKPWTRNPILQNWFFCNAFREWDKSTIWFRENVRDVLRDDPNVIFATVVFRLFNLPNVGERLLEKELFTDWRENHAKMLLREMTGDSERVFSPAYRVCPPMPKGSIKSDVVCDLLSEVWNQRDRLASDLEKMTRLRTATERFTEFRGIGSFIAYEIVTDLRFTCWLEDATDVMTWANTGPGAARGMNRLLGRPVRVECPGWLGHARKLLGIVEKKLRKMPKPHRYEMREIEHVCCEYDKLERVRLGDGQMRRKFNGVSS